MHPLVENFLERPMSQKIAAAAISVGLTGFIMWQYVVGPVMQQATDLEDKKNTLSTQIANEQRIARNLPKFQEEVKALEAKLKIALQELPDDKDIPDLLRQVADLAKDAGLEVSVFHPQPEVKRDFFAEVPVALTVEGTYHQIASFFDEVGRMPRIVNIRGIDMSQPKMTDRGMIVKADCSAVTFRYLPEAERVKADQEGEAKRRRK